MKPFLIKNRQAGRNYQPVGKGEVYEFQRIDGNDRRGSGFVVREIVGIAEGF
jgi:hypothetical protein